MTKTWTFLYQGPIEGENKGRHKVFKLKGISLLTKSSKVYNL